ncbi:MAG: hypothetical protein CMP10_01705 [Zetaproteobacteria bacterium]|nr:hypothetical protein [Pseudobdellovibrionaceae bacterium]
MEKLFITIIFLIVGCGSQKKIDLRSIKPLLSLRQVPLVGESNVSITVEVISNRTEWIGNLRKTCQDKKKILNEQLDVKSKFNINLLKVEDVENLQAKSRRCLSRDLLNQCVRYIYFHKIICRYSY